MFKKSLAVSVLLAIGIQNCMAQREIEALKELGQLRIIRLAVMDMQDSFEETQDNFDLTAYKESVWANSKEMKVLFKLPKIVFLPINSSFYGNLAGDVINKRFSMQVLANPTDYNGPTGFYPSYPEYEILEQIDFVIEAINKAHGEGAFTQEEFEGNIEIRENANFYDIITRLGATNTYFKVEKKTGRLYNERHRAVRLAPQVEDGFIKIID